MGAFLYSRPDDNVAPLATITTSGVQSAYPVGSLVDSHPAIPSKLNATSGWWKLDFGSARRVDVVALLSTNLTPGLANVRIQANTMDSFGSPPLEVTITIPPRRADSATGVPGTPTNPWVNLVTQPGYQVAGYRWWQLFFGTANAANISIGELVMLSELRTLPYGLSPGAVRAPRRRRVIHETDGGERLGYDLGVMQRSIKGEVEFKSAVKADVDAWHENSKGDLRPFLVVPDTDLNDAWWVTHLSDELPQTRVVLGMNRMPLEVMEVGGGIPT